MISSRFGQANGFLCSRWRDYVSAGDLRPTNFIENSSCGGRFVEDIKVKAGNAGVDQFLRLPGGPADAGVKLPVGFVLDIQFGHQFSRQPGFTERSDALDL